MHMRKDRYNDLFRDREQWNPILAIGIIVLFVALCLTFL